MSTIAVLAFKTGEIGIWGDTIVTRRDPVGPTIGRTSQGEIFQPISGPNGVQYFDEGACKVGAFGNKTICGITTDNLDFALDILIILEPQLSIPTNLQDLSQKAQNAATSLSGVQASPAIAQFIIATEVAEGRTFCLIEISRDSNGQCYLNKQCKPVKAGEEWCGFFGSGSERLTNIDKSGLASVGKLYESDPSTQTILPYCISAQLSSWIRNEYNEQAAGYGGIFLGYLLTNQGIFTTPDAMHIQADHNKDIKVFCKLVHREGVFYVHDLISRHLARYETLDGAMKRYNGHTPDLQKNDSEAFKFNSSFVALDVRTKEAPESTDVRIIEQKSGNRVLKETLPDTDQVIYPEPESPLQFKLMDGEILELKMPAFIPRN